MRIIGDVHGKVHQYHNLIKDIDESIQIGDFGFKNQHDWFIKNVKGDHKILFGNHDYYPYLNKPYSLGDYSFIESMNCFTVRGAFSIDKHLRTEGRDWFRNEELSYIEGVNVVQSYEQLKPDIVISHDCPEFVKNQLVTNPIRTITNDLLQALYEIHEPFLWIFGHYHLSLTIQESITEFRCLNELEYMDL